MNNYNKMHTDSTIPDVTIDKVETQETVPKQEEKTKLVTVTNCTQLNVRGKRSKSSPVLEIVNRGDELQVLEMFDFWVKVLVNNEEGYVMKEFVKEV